MGRQDKKSWKLVHEQKRQLSDEVDFLLNNAHSGVNRFRKTWGKRKDNAIFFRFSYSLEWVYILLRLWLDSSNVIRIERNDFVTLFDNYRKHL